MLQESAAEGYYADKLGVLRRTFAGKSVTLGKNSLIVEEQTYPIVDDVIILLPRMQWPSRLQGSGMSSDRDNTKRGSFSEEIQHTFGVQWNKFSVLMEEHEKEFEEYFDLTGTEGFKDQVLCDLGCGMGRWSYFLAPHCRNIILVDFSDAIFAARHTLRDAPNALFFMADINALPFAAEFTDFLFCLGVLHHIPVDALSLVRQLKSYSPRLLIYLYYALENRPFYFRVLFTMMAAVRRFIGRARNEKWRTFYVDVAVYMLYLPLAKLARLLRPYRLDRFIPLHYYADKSLERVRQDAYDKLMTRVEQRFTGDQILTLQDTFPRVTISPSEPYWHFLCER